MNNTSTISTTGALGNWGWKASHEQISIYFVTFLTLLALVLVLSRCLHRTPKLASILPEAGMVILVGIFFGSLIHIMLGDVKQLNTIDDTNDDLNDDALNENNIDAAEEEVLSFDPTVFFMVFLPPIIFNSGYNLRRELLIRHIRPIIMFSCLGTILSALLVAFILYSVTSKASSNFNPTLAELLTFGSLISATDPVSTLAVFQEKKVDPQLFMLVFGESVLNDAVGLILFNSFAKFVGHENTFETVALAALKFGLDFIFIFVGSFVLGMVSGILVGLLLKVANMQSFHVLELSLYVLVMYVPFFIADVIGLSSIVTILFTGISAKSYAQPNLSRQTDSVADSFFRVTAHLAETSIFLEMGLSVFGLFTSGEGKLHFRFIAWALLACLVGRAIFIYPFSWWHNRSILKYHCYLSEHHLNESQDDKDYTNIQHKSNFIISSNLQHMIWFSGLRGAVAYACAKSFPNNLNHRKDFVITTIVIVLVTVFLFGGTTEIALRLLRIDINVDEEKYRLDDNDQWMGMFHSFEKKYILPCILKGDSHLDDLTLEVSGESLSKNPRGPLSDIVDQSQTSNSNSNNDTNQSNGNNYVNVGTMKAELELREMKCAPFIT